VSGALFIQRSTRHSGGVMPISAAPSVGLGSSAGPGALVALPEPGAGAARVADGREVLLHDRRNTDAHATTLVGRIRHCTNVSGLAFQSTVAGRVAAVSQSQGNVFAAALFDQTRALRRMRAWHLDCIVSRSVRLSIGDRL
jgi:hypothetical protein